MTKGIFSKLAALKSMSLFVFVLSVLLAGSVFTNTVNAQNITGDSANWQFLPLEIDISHGDSAGTFKDIPAAAGVHNVKFVSAILSASDENKNIYGSNNLWRDGSVDTATGQGQLLKQIFYKVDTTNSGPIIANIESSDITDTGKANEPLNMVAIIQNVSADLVTAIRNEALGGSTAQSIINLITAELSSGIFGANAGDTYANVRPTSGSGVLGIIGSSPSDLGLTNQMASGENLTYGTQIIVRWDSISNTALKASATDINVAASNFGATITINGLGASAAPSNQIGLEVDGFADATTLGAAARQSGPAITYTNSVPTVEFKSLYDTVSTSYNFAGTAVVPALELNTVADGVRAPISMFNPFGVDSTLAAGQTTFTQLRSGVIRLTTDTNPRVTQIVGKPLQFRASDIVVIQSKFNINANLDGEPDAYYGTNSDPISFGDLKTGNDVLTARYNNLNSAGEISNSSSKIKVTITSKTDSEVVNVPDFTTVSLITAEGTNSTAVGDNAVLDVTFPISNTLQTSGESEKINFSVLIQDDIGYVTTSVNAENGVDDVFHVDTLAPIATQMSLRGEINETISTGSTGYRASRKITGGTTAFDEMVVSLGFQTNGENSNDFAQWANVTISPSTDATSNWINDASAVSLNTALATATVGTADALSTGLIHGSSERNLVTGVSGGQVLGVSTFIRFRTPPTITTSILTAYAIASVSDDARNPAIAWVHEDPVANNVDDRILFTKTTRIKQSSTGVVNFTDKGNRSPYPFIDSSTASITALNNNNPSVFTTINSSTLAVDNNAPHILSASLTVLRAPDNFWSDVTSTSSDGLTRFGQILNTTEALISPVNSAKLIELGTTALKAHGRTIMQSTRATAANVNSGSQNQSGSPLRLVVQFAPNGNFNGTNPADTAGTDHFTSSGENASSTGVSYVRDHYTFGIGSEQLGFATHTSLAGTLDSDWTLTDAQIISSSLGYATFENTVGLKESNIYNDTLETGNNRSISDATVEIIIYDNVANTPSSTKEKGGDQLAAQNAYSSTIIIDVSAPVAGRQFPKFTVDASAYELLGHLTNGYGVMATQIVAITNTGGRSFTEIVAELDNETAPGSTIGSGTGIFRHLAAFAGSGAASVQDSSSFVTGFINSVTRFLAGGGGDFTRTDIFDVNEKAFAIDTASRTVQAGYMIIISSTFSEPNGGDNTSNDNPYQRFGNLGRTNFDNNPLVGSFPYIISASEARGERATNEAAPVWSVDAIDSASFEYGNSWKTVSADFSDFVVGAKAVLPTVSSVVPSTTGTGSIDAAGIFAATWFYQVDTSNVNTSISSSVVRAVTLFARDLSGNVTYDVIPVGLADFSVPVITIDHLSMSIPSRTTDTNGYGNLLLEGTGTGIAAGAISAATYNKNDATMSLVAKVTGSALKTDGGEFFANLSNLGGGSSVAPSATSTVPAGVAVTSITTGTIYYATWEIGKFNTSLINRTGKITVSAIGSSLTQTNKDSVRIDVDQVPPSFNASNAFTNTVIEENKNGTDTNSSFDTKGDSVIRPGQTFVLAVRLNNISGTVGTEGDNAGADIQVTGDFSSFGLGTAVAKEEFTNQAGSIYTATWQLTVPSDKATGLGQAIISATDPAGNATTLTTESVFIQSGQPVVVSNVLSSSKDVGSASSSALPALKSFFEVANVNNSASITYPNNNLAPFVIKNNEQITIFAEAFISSDGFTNVGIAADLSQIVNTVPTRQDFIDSSISSVVSNGSNVVFPTEKEAGNNIDATWTIALTDLKDTGSVANIILTATVGDTAAFSSISNATTTVPLMVDTTAPQVSLVNSWYKSGKSVTESSLFSSTPNGATAGVIVYATLTDASVIRGYIGSPIVAANEAGVTLVSATRNLINLSAADFGSISYVTPAYWTLSDRTGAFADTAGVHLITSGSSMLEIANSTATVLTAYYGEIPESVRVFAQIPASAIPAITVTSTNTKAAKFTASVTDAVGNSGTATSLEVEADGTAPIVQKDPFRIAIVPGTTHIPATFDAAGDIVTNTRVSNGSQLTGKFTVSDSPDKADAMVVLVTAANFGATSFEVTSLATSDISGFAKNPGDFGWTFTATPSNASDVTVFATFTAGSKGTNSQAFDLKDIDEQDGAIDFGYNQARLSSLDDGFFANGASLEVQVIDSESNSVAGKKSIALDYDIEAPKFTQTSGGTNEVALLALDSLSAVNALTRADKATFDNRGKLRNLKTSQWIVLAGSIVVDGTDDSHLTKFDVNWEEALEQDIGRLVAGSETSGSVIVIESVTPAARAVRFVTNAVQIRTTASPLGAQDIKVTFADFFGNEATNTLDKVAINASGPSANEVRLFVNGVSQLSGTSLLGIGNGGPDSASSSFELAPGDTIEVEAIINTVGTGRAPQFIYANFSSLYPPELLHSVDQIVPSATSVTADGTVLASWSHIAADYRNIIATSAIAFNDVQLTSAEISSPLFNNGIIAGATLTTATSITLGNGAINDLGASQTILNNLSGLPLIQVQQNADPTMDASISIFVDENAPLNLFGSTSSASTKFAVDTQTPIASWYVPWELITRQLAPSITGLTGYDRATGKVDEAKGRARVGFPTTPVLTALDILNTGDENNDLTSIFNVPARVRGGDTVYIIANVTNSNISNNGDDKFRPYPGTTFDSSTIFDINSSNVDINADLSQFGGSALSNVSILGTTTGSDASPAFNVLTKNQNYSGKANQIAATFALTISSELGDTAASSREARDATFVVTDDAGNKPFDTFETRKANQTLNEIKRLVRPGAIGVDNRAPTISGTLDVINLSNNNATLQNGSAIVGGSKLKITANINDSVDNPLDVLNNPNWGSVTLSAQGITLSNNDVILLATEALLSGNSVSVPFSVDIPAVETGISTSEFQFRISATDSLGNATSRLSNDKFKFDARPDIKWVDASANTISESITFHAGGPALVLSANSFDVGGVSDVVISIDGADAASQIALLSADGITLDSTFLGAGATGTENVNVPVTITSLPSINSSRLFTFLIADVTDVSGATNTSQIAVNYNRPAIFNSQFALTAVNSSGSDIAPATVISGSGSLETEGDIRTITITEGSTVTVALAASDGDNDAIVYSATGTAFDSIFEDSVYDATTNVFTFKSGFKSLTEGETSKTVDATFTANDSKHPTSDSVTIRITINAESAVPVVNISSINITNVRTNAITSATASENDSVQINENSNVEIVLVATDAGNENLVFTTAVDTALNVATEISNSTGIATATVTFNLGFDDADIVISESALDPSLLTFSASNGTNTGSVTKSIDVINSSQPGVITSTFTRNGGTAQSISDGSSVVASPGDTIIFSINVADPDQIDRFDFPVTTFTQDNPAFNITSQFVGTNGTGTSVDNSVTVVVANPVAADTSATINYSAQKDTLDAIISTATYFVEASSTPPVPVTQIDELVLAQGSGGAQLVNVRNFDSGSATAVNGIIDQFRSVGPNALTAWGGGNGRGTKVSIGDADNDSDLDYVLSFGPINTATAATLPNIFVPMDLTTKQVVGLAPHAFPTAGPIGYVTGDLTTAIGDFMVDGTNQVAVAQGAGSSRSLVRIFEFVSGATRPWKVVAQFQPLDNTPNNNNANGGVSLDAADVDGDGLSELIVGQTASASSLTQFTVIDIDNTLNANGISNGSHVRRNFVAFEAGFRGGGGVDVVAADLNNDGVNELVFTSDALNGSTELGSLARVVRPVITDNAVSGYERPDGGLVQLVTGDANPGGGLSIAAGEFDGDTTNGQELLIGSGAGAPQSFYRVVKVSYDGTSVTGTTFLIGPAGNFSFTQPAFLDTFNPTSGAVNVEAANHTVRN